MVQDGLISYILIIYVIKLMNDLFFNNNIFIFIIIPKLCQPILINTNYQ
jgi:hypothetical protein